MTGASRGIGRAIALELAKTHELILVSRSNTPEASKQSLLSERVQWLACDLSCPQSISQQLLPVRAIRKLFYFTDAPKYAD